MDEVTRQAYLTAMGIDVWTPRSIAPVELDTSVLAGSEVSKMSLEVAQPATSEWSALQQRVSVCTLCDLHKDRTQTVFGVGNRDADLMIIGEAPGAEEDRQGEPFVGRAGKLLNAMLSAIGFRRKEVFIANILKCRPPQNRDPLPGEAAVCESYLLEQIALIRPRMILAVGRIAAQNLLKVQTPIGKMRGQRYTFGALNIPVVVTYHPAYLLRSPAQKRVVWQDLLVVKRTMEAV